jgi:hypothetical protein
MILGFVLFKSFCLGCSNVNIAFTSTVSGQPIASMYAFKVMLYTSSHLRVG